MSEVKTNRSIWKDLFLWYMIALIGTIILELLCSLIRGIAGTVVSVIVALIISLAFLVYEIMYLNDLVDDLNIVCSHVEEDENHDSKSYWIVLILSLITLGGYRIYWLYKQGNRLNVALEKYGIRSAEKGLTYIILNIPVLLIPFGRFIAGYLFFDNLNKACDAYKYGRKNKRSENGNKPETYKIPGDEVTVSVPVIVGTNGEYAGQELDLPFGDAIVMGRDAQKANLVFSSEKISKIHCKITFSNEENCFYVTDYSRNGVFTNGGRRLNTGKAERLNRGSKLILSDSEEFLLR